MLLQVHVHQTQKKSMIEQSWDVVENATLIAWNAERKSQQDKGVLMDSSGDLKRSNLEIHILKKDRGFYNC